MPQVPSHGCPRKALHWSVNHDAPRSPMCVVASPGPSLPSTAIARSTRSTKRRSMARRRSRGHRFGRHRARTRYSRSCSRRSSADRRVCGTWARRGRRRVEARPARADSTRAGTAIGTPTGHPRRGEFLKPLMRRCFSAANRSAGLALVGLSRMRRRPQKYQARQGVGKSRASPVSVPAACFAARFSLHPESCGRALDAQAQALFERQERRAASG